MAEFQLLGPVDVVAKGTTVDAGRPRQRAVLAALLVDAGRVVSRATIVDRVWGDAPPDNSDATLRAHVARVRRVLERAGAADGESAALVHAAGGYRLAVDAEQVDLHRFRRLLRLAQDASHERDRAAQLRGALALWRGQPLAGVAGDWAQRMRESWGRERMRAGDRRWRSWPASTRRRRMRSGCGWPGEDQSQVSQECGTSV